MKNGFTLIELLIIIAILGVLSVIVIPTVKNSIDEAKDSTYDVQINTITEAAENYFMHINSDINEPTVIYLEDILKSGYLDVSAVIIVERKSQKGIIIGKEGQMIKKIGVAARKDMESLLGNKIYLSTFVKVEEDWRNNAHHLKEYGYNSKD